MKEINKMKLRWLIPIAVSLPFRLGATGPAVSARVATITINPNQVTALHLRPEFESTIRMPEEITSVILGSPSSFKAEHNEGEPQYVYVKPITKDPVQSNLLIATKSGQHVTLELISDGASANNANQAVDFLIEYRVSRSFLVVSDAAVPVMPKPNEKATPPGGSPSHPSSAVPSALDQEFEQQAKLNTPKWTKWDGKQIETSIGDIRQWSNETVISYSVYNSSDQPVEIVAPQIQSPGVRQKRRKRKKARASSPINLRSATTNSA
jgi:hypothetical protein